MVDDMKRLIIITHPDFIANEASIIESIIDADADVVHVRKPHAPIEQTERLLQKISPQYHNRLVLHDAHTLAQHYKVGGLHLNSRNPVTPTGWSGMVSRSCHSIEEVAQYKNQCNYLFLSPIFDSISKQNYKASFTAQELLQAQSRGIIDNKTIALGGITIEKIGEVINYGFGGIALLGYIWNNIRNKDIKPIINDIKKELTCYNL